MVYGEILERVEHMSGILRTNAGTEEELVKVEEELNILKESLRMYEDPPPVDEMGIDVSGYQYHGYGLSKHCRYRIERTWKGKRLTVYRRFSDFVQLYNKLCELYPGFVVPSHPEKVYMNNEQVIIERMEWFQAFLGTILSHHKMSESSWVRNFLLLATEDWQRLLDEDLRRQEEREQEGNGTSLVSNYISKYPGKLLQNFAGFSTGKRIASSTTSISNISVNDSIVKIHNPVSAEIEFHKLCSCETPLFCAAPPLTINNINSNTINSNNNSNSVEENVQIRVETRHGRAKTVSRLGKTYLHFTKLLNEWNNCLMNLSTSTKELEENSMELFSDSLKELSTNGKNAEKQIKERSHSGSLQLVLKSSLVVEGACQAFSRFQALEKTPRELQEMELSLGKDFEFYNNSIKEGMGTALYKLANIQIERAQKNQKILNDLKQMLSHDINDDDDATQRARLGLEKPKIWQWDIDTPM